MTTWTYFSTRWTGAPTWVQGPNPRPVPPAWRAAPRGGLSLQVPISISLGPGSRPAAPCTADSPSLAGYLLSLFTVTLFLLMIGSTAFSNWWLGFWLDKASEVSGPRAPADAEEVAPGSLTPPDAPRARPPLVAPAHPERFRACNPFLLSRQRASGFCVPPSIFLKNLFY